MHPALPLLALLAAPPADLCAGRPRCRVAQELPAGKDAAGRPLTVVRLALDARDTASDPPDADLDRCVPYEWWLRRGAESRALLRLCNDGYGAAGVGEDAVDVAPNRFTHVQHGGSSWRWTTTRVLQLAPLRPVSEATEGAWTLGLNEESCGWDRTTWKGTCNWTAPRCDADGNPVGGDDAAGPAYAFRRLPAPALPAGWRSEGWRAAALGTCAAEADYAVHGAPAPADARLRVVAGPEDELYVEVEDDVWQKGAKNWIFDDHVELWAGEGATYMDHCLADDEHRPVQWGIGLFEPWVRPGFGDPKSLPAVERAVLPGRVRLKIRLPSHAEGVTVVYSDSDDGRTQERLIATSALRHGDGASLGRRLPIPSDDALCVVRNGRLDFDDVWKAPATGAVLGGAPEEEAAATEAPDQGPPAPAPTRVEDLAWLAGAWRADGTEEIWLPPAGGMLIGLGRTIARDGASFEYLRIEPDGSGALVYVAMPGGSAPTTFRLASRGEREVAFENPAHDFPRRIDYRREGDTLKVRLEGVEGGRPRTLETTWRLGPLVPLTEKR
jgi:hypothetical protein